MERLELRDVYLQEFTLTEADTRLVEEHLATLVDEFVVLPPPRTFAEVLSLLRAAE